MNKEALDKLEIKRELMIQSGIENGLQNPKTIRLSRELDQMMNQFEDEENMNNKESLS
ncbi:aspartyl-phosphate phosphatase Spo0E family protein [Ureibacillus manganicus]|uniref:aspartyl-phosphate phosphatase Spo0E family protein n=1 Tax=Ureibacillus manganicus TaxID=1266064 RepID=UPI000A873CCD|nr:aspartyl-phosphate phosphatase Spo0E family protein [Ureibacillus manganicus]